MRKRHALLIDNAAVASQNVSLVDDAVTREAIQLSIIDPFQRDIDEFMKRLGPRWFLEQGWFPKSAEKD